MLSPESHWLAILLPKDLSREPSYNAWLNLHILAYVNPLASWLQEKVMGLKLLSINVRARNEGSH